MPKDEQPAPTPDPDAGHKQPSEEEQANLQVQEDAAKKREESRGYQ